MSALLKELPHYRRMTTDDLDAIMAIENAIYPHPWTRGNFDDSLKSGYHCSAMTIAGEIIGYGVVMIAAGEAHLLNLSIAAAWQRRGFGGGNVGFPVKLLPAFEVVQMYREVCSSKWPAR